MTADGNTVLMCTHLLLEAEGLADQVVVLDHGTDLIAGTPHDLTQQFWPGVVVRLDAEDRAALDRLQEFEGVMTYARNGAGAELQLDDESRIPDLVFALTAAGVRVTRVEPHRPNLEDLYFARAVGPRSARCRWTDRPRSPAVGRQAPTARRPRRRCTSDRVARRSSTGRGCSRSPAPT